ncbi:hypothetical protein [Sulfitobacter sp.]|uniref:hypothetical protein n=1 Tax=Sulfitobacter sp. TaxID=1903071 RepID=UPI003003568D
MASLNAGALWIDPKKAAGVPKMLIEDSGIAIALKSGIFGGPDFFGKSLTMMMKPR